MQIPRLIRTVGAAVLAIGLLLGTAGTSQAAYPPGGVGTIKVIPMDCVYAADGSFEGASSFLVTFDVQTPEADVRVVRDDGEVIHHETVTMGRGGYEYRPEGLAVFMSYRAELIGYAESGWDTVSATIYGCPVPEVTGTNDGTTRVNPPTPRAATTTNAKPVTGSASWPVAAIAVGLLLIGVAMVAGSRRRTLPS